MSEAHEGAYVENVEVERVDVGARFVAHELFFLHRVDDYVHDEAAAFEIQGQGPSDGFTRASCYHHHFLSRPVTGPSGPSLSTV